MGRSIDALSGVEVDVDDAVLGKVCALDLGVAGGSSDHGTAVHVHEDGKILSILGGPDVKVQAILILASEGIATSLRTGSSIGLGLERSVRLGKILRSLPSA